MNLSSSDLPVGYTGEITADQFNRLRNDLMKAHDHAQGGDNRGGQIAHSNLEDGELASISHAIINTHLQGTGTSGSPDSPGGSQGVHGIDSAHYVAGSGKRHLVVQIGDGTDYTDRGGESDDDYEQRGRGTFGEVYSEPPFVVLVANLSGEASTVTVSQRLTTSFAVKFRFRDESSYSDGSQHNIYFNWIAFGVIDA